jgi:predicted phage-related endonuclease
MEALQTERHPRALHIYDPAKELDALATEYKALQRQQETIKAQLDELKATMIQEMAGQEVVTAGVYKISNKTIVSTRLDMDTFKAVHPDIFKVFSKTSTSTRFTVD